MAKNTVGDWDTTPGNNTDVGGENIAEGCSPGTINNAIRTIMAQIKTAIGVSFQAQDAGLQAIADATITGVSGADADVLTGTAGTDGNLSKWNADGDLVDATVAVADIDPRGVHTLYFPATAFKSLSSGGPEESSSDVETYGFDFDPDAVETLRLKVPMPKSWDEGTLTAKIDWCEASTAGTGDVVWGVQMLAVGDGDAMDAAMGTAQTVTDSFVSANKINITSETSAITPAGTATEGDFLFINVYRDATNGSDTYTQDARFTGLLVFLTTDAATDA